MNTCPICESNIVSPSGDPSSNILLIGEFPGEDEMIAGIPFVGKAGYVLKKEIYRNKVDYKRLRATNLWLHPSHKAKSRKKEDQKLAKDLNEKCLKYCMEQLLEEAQGKDAVLLLGSDSVKVLADRSVSEWAGLEIKSDYLDAHLIMCTPNPAQVYHVPFGEVRLSIYKFCKEIKKRNYYE
jgi:uracil-DNA glycosylase